MAVAGNQRLAWERRDQNVDELWEPFHALGFCVVDEHGMRVDRATALRERMVLKLHRLHQHIVVSEKIGFFTHSLIGNALLLLAGPPSTRFSLPNGAEMTLDALAQQPNRHYLSNATPVDLGAVVLVRHGLTQANQRGIALGRSDGADDWRGELVERFVREAPSDVVSWHCSTLLRTRQTAHMFGVEDPSFHAALDEMDIGAAEGIEEPEVIASFVSAKLMYHHGDPFAAIVDELGRDPPCAPGECFVQVLLRVARCLREEICAR
jgi:hypothetical protein